MFKWSLFTYSSTHRVLRGCVANTILKIPFMPHAWLLPFNLMDFSHFLLLVCMRLYVSFETQKKAIVVHITITCEHFLPSGARWQYLFTVCWRVVIVRPFYCRHLNEIGKNILAEARQPNHNLMNAELSLIFYIGLESIFGLLVSFFQLRLIWKFKKKSDFFY